MPCTGALEMHARGLLAANLPPIEPQQRAGSKRRRQEADDGEEGEEAELDNEEEEEEEEGRMHQHWRRQPQQPRGRARGRGRGRGRPPKRQVPPLQASNAIDRALDVLKSLPHNPLKLEP